MHVYWVGIAADLWRQGDRSLEWLLKEAMAGEVFAAGHAERGNDLPVLLSTSKAERVEGGFRITGHKMFGSLAPVWTRYGLHATWADAEGGPKIVHAFMPRDTPGLPHRRDLGHAGHARDAQRRRDAGGRVRARQVHRADPARPAAPTHSCSGIFAWALLGFANIYYGIAQRAMRPRRRRR